MPDMDGVPAPPVTIARVTDKLVGERQQAEAPAHRDVLFEVDGLTASYSDVPALRDVSLDVFRNSVTAFIGPSGCGKSTFIRCFNRMNDLVPGAHVHGDVRYHGKALYAGDVDPVEVRRRIGMVFQKPNPFPKSIYDNIAFGPRVLGLKDNLDQRVESALQRAALRSDDSTTSSSSAFFFTPLSRGPNARLS